MIHVCQGDPLAKLIDDMQVSPSALPKLETEKGEINQIQTADKMFN